MYDGQDEGRDLFLSVPPLSDQCVLELSGFLQALADLIADEYAIPLRRAWRQRNAEQHRRCGLHRCDDAQLSLPFEESAARPEPPF